MIPLNFDITTVFGVAEFDQFKLPPLVVLKDADIKLIMSTLSTRRSRKYWAASIILGQPFA